MRETNFLNGYAMTSIATNRNGAVSCAQNASMEGF